nr:MAG TPA: hypothetical protein [Caudoviricetes sp.]
MCGPGTTLCLANLAPRTSIARGLNTAWCKSYRGIPGVLSRVP